MIEVELIAENENSVLSAGKSFVNDEILISIRKKDSIFPECFFLSERDLRHMMFHFKQVLERKEFLRQQKTKELK